MDLALTLRNYKIKDIIKVARSLENREILLKGTTGKIISQKEGLFNFLALLTRVGLPLMEIVLTPLAKSVLIPVGLTAAVSAT